MKVDLFTAPLSDEGKAILEDREAANELLFKLLQDTKLRNFEVKAGNRTFDVAAEIPVTADRRR